ncbi:N-acetyl sugar amidotransferase [Dongshaea marina]|uniref:N-acetyl sugar amidotransferase n=1 Tax=Dongshaea marina TaxID=2047966 RepID=UPI000D3E636A|nr:N-acetyl sugar amidotransferase [Dongshaea marina]
MAQISAPSRVDTRLFSPEASINGTKYGLPSEVYYCKKCVISNQRPNSAVEFKHTNKSKKKTIHFDSEGVCDACRLSEQKNNTIDWELRDKALRELCDRHRSKNGYYDCLVPGSGGKDSFYAAHILKEKYGMHPLTVTWAPHIYTEWGWKNFQSWIHAGLDNYLMTPNGRVHRLLTRLAVENLLHPFQPFMLGQKLLAPKMAKKFNIPLIFYGENEAEYGNPIADTNSPLRSSEYFSSSDYDELYLGGVSLTELQEDFGLVSQDLIPYLPISEGDIEECNIETHYLGYYLKWHPQSCYYYAVENGGFVASPERTPGTYSKYNSIDDRIDDLHYYTTGVKFGLGRASYDAAQEIRSLDIERDEGVALVRRYDHEFPERFIDELLSYLSIPENEFPVAATQFESPVMDRHYFDRLCDSFRSPHLWIYDKGLWRLRHPLEE